MMRKRSTKGLLGIITAMCIILFALTASCQVFAAEGVAEEETDFEVALSPDKKEIYITGLTGTDITTSDQADLKWSTSDSDIVEVVQSGTMNIYFNDGSMIGTPTNMLPGDSVSMTFRVENFGSLDTKYSIYLYVYENTFVTKSDLVYTLTSDDGVNISETVVPSSDSSIALDIPISTGNIHYYELLILRRVSSTL